LIPALGRLRRLLLGISPRETSFSRRGFQAGDPARREHLEQIGQTFVHGYHAALSDPRPDALGDALDAVSMETRGFAFEGAAMALSLLDHLAPWRRNRWHAFLTGPGSPHAYMVHVGRGWALARLRRPVARALERLDPVLGWLVVDGYGFHEGYFHWPRWVQERAEPARLTGYARRVFDQGLGRSLWFVDGADVTRIPRTIDAFPAARHADLWSGVGLACAYAGGVARDELAALRPAAGAFHPDLAQGVAFAAKARERAGNLAPHTELACEVLCNSSAAEAAALSDATFADLPRDGSEPAYEVWRRRIRTRFGG